MFRKTTPLLAVLAVAACDLPTDSNAARGRLADRTETTAALTVPFPAMLFEADDYLARGDAKLGSLLSPAAESLEYATNWNELNVSSVLTSFHQTFPVRAADFGPAFAALLDLVELQNVSVQLEVENTGDHAVTLESVNVSLIDAAGAVVQRAAPANASGGLTIAANSKGKVDVPAAALIDLLLGDIARGDDIQISVDIGRMSVQAGGSVKLRTRANVRAPIIIELGSREVHFRHVLHTQLDGDEELLQQLNALEVDSAWLDIDIVNAVPIAVRAAVTIAPSPADTTGFDPVTSPERISLAPIVIEAAKAKADGKVTARGITHTSVLLSASTINLLRSGSVSLAGDFTITATADRFRIGHDNSFEVKASARIRVKHKGR